MTYCVSHVLIYFDSGLVHLVQTEPILTMVNSGTSFPRPSTLARESASWSLSDRWKKHTLAYTFDDTLDRVNVLGDEYSGHTG